MSYSKGTSAATPGEIARRGPSGEIVFTRVATSDDAAVAGQLAFADGFSAVGINSSSTECTIFGDTEPNTLAFGGAPGGGSDWATVVYRAGTTWQGLSGGSMLLDVATAGTCTFRVNSTTAVTLGASYVNVGSGTKRFQDSAPSANGHMSIDADGRVAAYPVSNTVTGTSALRSCITFGDLAITFDYDHTPDTAAGDTTEYTLGGFAGDLTSFAVSLYQNSILTADNTNYARIDLVADDPGGEILVARAETRVSGGTNPTGNWTLRSINYPTPETLSPNYIAGSVPYFVRITKLGSGVQLGKFRLRVEAFYDGFR